MNQLKTNDIDKLLQCNFAGIIFSNPFIVASCPCTRDANHIIEAAEHGWAGAVIKTTTNHPPYFQNPSPSLSPVKTNGVIVGMTSNEIFTDISLTEWCKNEIPKIKSKTNSSFKLIGSVMEGPNEEHWVETCLMLEKAGVDLIEMNISCPHGMSKKYMGKYIQDDPSLLFSIINNCKKELSIPLIVKLNARTNNTSAILDSCHRAGVDGITATNSLLAIPSVNINSYIPNPICNNSSTFSGYCGPGIRPIALSFIAEIAQTTNIPISGVGGIETWENIIEFFLLGASTVQVCSKVMTSGFNIVLNFKDGIAAYLQEKGFTNIQNITGLALKSLISSTEITNCTIKSKISLINENCTKCGSCITACKTSALNAISITDGSISIDHNKCICCGLCTFICPQQVIIVEMQKEM